MGVGEEWEGTTCTMVSGQNGSRREGRGRGSGAVTAAYHHARDTRAGEKRGFGSKRKRGGAGGWDGGGGSRERRGS